MRVAMISYHTCPLATLGGKDTGGMNVYIRDLTRQLGVMGIQVDVFTRSQDEHVPHVLHDLGYGNRIVHIPAGPEVPLPREVLYSHLSEFVQNIREFAQIKKFKYDLIHSNYWLSGIAASQMKRDWNIPVVHMFHTLGVMKQRIARSEAERDGDFRLEGEKQVIKIADKIVVATQAEKAQLIWLYQTDEKKVEIIPPGVDLSHFYPIPQEEAKEYIGVPPCERMVLFVGRIEPLKGIDVLIQAISILRQRDKNKKHSFCLAVIGGATDGNASSEKNLDTDEMKRLKTLCRNYGLQDLVLFLGQKSQDTLPYYYSAAEAVVVPSFYESFGMVALEAMACGTPVIASEVGGLAFLVKNQKTGFTVPVDEPEKLADCISILLENPELRSQMGAEGAKFAMDYGWDKIANKVKLLYDDVISQPM